MAYWVKFSDGTKPACVHVGAGVYEKAKRLYPHSDEWSQRNQVLENEAASYAGLFAPVESIQSLPYGAWPSLDGHRPGDFCFTPERCAGWSSCPRNYACSE